MFIRFSSQKKKLDLFHENKTFLSVLGLKGENETETVHTPDLSKCGINYCPAPAAVINETIEEQEIEEDNFSASRYQLFILAGVYLACSILSAVVVAIFVEPLSK